MIEESNKINIFKIESKEDIQNFLKIKHDQLLTNLIWEPIFSMLAFSQNTDWENKSVYIESNKENVTIEIRAKQTFTKKKEGVWTN